MTQNAMVSESLIPNVKYPKSEVSSTKSGLKPRKMMRQPEK